MYVIYWWLRLMVRVSLRIFYKEFSVNGRERLPHDGPLIMVANHPNTLMDPLVVGSLMRQQVGFMGNGSLFRSKPLAWLLRTFNVIPVYRKQDIRPGEQIDNEDNFQHAREWLGKGGTILIFPEGTSFAEKRLRELRTGAARIALSYESSRGFEGGLRVMPAALNYSASTRFRTRLRIDVGHPIPVKDFAELHAQDPVEAVRALTEAQRVQMAERMVILEDKDQERMHEQLGVLWHPAGQPQVGHAALRAEMDLADRIRALHAEQPERARALGLRLDQWHGWVDRLQLTPGFFRDRFRKWPPAALWLLMLLVLVVGSPLYIFGLLTCWFPYWFPGWIAPRISDEIEYHAPTMMVIGMFLFPLWHGLMLLGVALLGVPWPWIAGLAVLLPAAGFYTLWHVAQMERFEAITSLLLLKRRRKSLFVMLDEEQAALRAEAAAALGLPAS